MGLKSLTLDDSAFEKVVEFKQGNEGSLRDLIW